MHEAIVLFMLCIMLVYAKDCNSYLCPDYKVTSKYEQFEIRQYQAVNWIAIDKPTYSDAIGEGYTALRQYLDGANDQGVKLNVTLPILVRCGRVFTTSLFLACNSCTHWPRPINPDLRIIQAPTNGIAAMKFREPKGQYADILKYAAYFRETLRESLIYAPTDFYFAGYELTQGINPEVWYEV